MSTSCYFCWIAQFDKCTSNCNRFRAVPRYGNYDIEPSGKMRLRSTAESSTFTEWSEQQDSRRRQQEQGKYSRYELIQERKYRWATRAEIDDSDLTGVTRGRHRGGENQQLRFSSLIRDGTRNGTVSLPEDTGPRVSLMAKSAGNIPQQSTRPFFYGVELPAGSAEGVKNKDSQRGDDDDARGGVSSEAATIHSCRKPVVSEIPYKYSRNTYKVQVTPYTITTVPVPRGAIANPTTRAAERGEPGLQASKNGGRSPSASLRRRDSPSISREVDRSSLTNKRATRSKSASTTIGLVTTGHYDQAHGVSVQGGKVGLTGSKFTVASDIVESEILSGRYHSAYEMPLPLLFYEE